MKTEIKLWVISPTEPWAAKLARYESEGDANVFDSEVKARGRLAHVLAHLGNDEQFNSWYRACRIWPVTKTIEVGEPVDAKKGGEP